MDRGLEPKPLAGLEEIPLYVPGKSGGGKKADKPVRLASNESPFGASPSVQAALAEAVARSHRYPPPGGAALATALSKHFGLPVERLVCGAGSDELIALLVRGLCRHRRLRVACPARIYRSSLGNSGGAGSSAGDWVGSQSAYVAGVARRTM